MTDDQIKHMVDRFLSWRLPETFNPDGGISFKKTFNDHTAHPAKHEPTGTNLFDATQADAMVRHMVEGMPGALRQELVLTKEYDDSSGVPVLRRQSISLVSKG